MMIISILGAMQTFARKTVNMADRRWSQALPFLVFSFGSVYAVAQYYFILQGGLTRAGLSAIINGTVFAVGTITLILLLRQHLKLPSVSSIGAENTSNEEHVQTASESLEATNLDQQNQQIEADLSTVGDVPEAASESQNVDGAEPDSREASETEN